MMYLVVFASGAFMGYAIGRAVWMTQSDAGVESCENSAQNTANTTKQGIL